MKIHYVTLYRSYGSTGSPRANINPEQANVNPEQSNINFEREGINLPRANVSQKHTLSLILSLSKDIQHKLNILLLLIGLCTLAKTQSLPNPAYWQNGIPLRLNENHPDSRYKNEQHTTAKEKIVAGAAAQDPFFLPLACMRYCPDDTVWYPVGRIYLTNSSLKEPFEWYVRIAFQPDDQAIDNDKVVAFFDNDEIVSALFNIQPHVNGKNGVFVLKKMGDEKTFSDLYWQDQKAFAAFMDSKVASKTAQSALISECTHGSCEHHSSCGDKDCDIDSAEQMFTKRRMAWIFMLVFLIASAAIVLWPMRKKR